MLPSSYPCRSRLRQYVSDKQNLPLLTAIVIIAAIAAITIGLWATNASNPADFAPEEAIIDYLAGQNFATHGFIERGFLTDHSLDNAPDAPAVYYTHQPPLPIIIIGGLISGGLDSLPEIRLIMILIFLAGLVAVLAFFWRLLSPWHGIAVVVMLALNGCHVLPLSDHTTHVYWLGLTFLTLWALSHPKGKPVYIWVAVIAVLLTAWTNYIQLIVLLATIGCLWILRVPNFTFKRLLLAAIVAAGGIGLHIIQNIIVLGPEIAVQDIYLSLGNRIWGDPTREALRAFSQQNNIILWGVNSAGITGNPFSILYREFSGFIIPIILSLAGLALITWRFRLSSNYFVLRLLAVFILAASSFYIILPAAATAYPLPFIIAIPIAMISGLFIGETVSIAHNHLHLPENINRVFALFRYNKIFVSLVLVALISVGLTAATSWQSLSREVAYNRDFTAAEMQLLNEFEGEVFWTNITPHQVSYYTGSPAVGQINYDGFIARDINQAYVIPVSIYSPTWQEVNNPRYFFFGRRHVHSDTEDQLEEFRRYLIANYPVLAWSADHSSLVVDMSVGPIGTSRITAGRQGSVESNFVEINIDSDQIEASSSQDPESSAANLLTDDGSFWHAKMPRQENPAWISIDLTEPKSLAEFWLKPRPGHTAQLWDGNRAVLQASQDGQIWVSLTALGLDRTALADAWINFPVFSTTPYRYYRLACYAPDFISIGAVKLTEIPVVKSEIPTEPTVTEEDLPVIVAGVQEFDTSLYQEVKLKSEQLEVSSTNDASQGKDKLLLPGTDGFWHVISPREENPAWVSIDLTTPASVSLLQIRPRAGMPDNMWNGPAATLQASNDAVNWTDIAVLKVDKESLTDDWVSFPLPYYGSKYRHYSLAIEDMEFFSIARLKLYLR